MSFICSAKFFYLILFIFIFESGKLAITSRYPMAFDEGFHLELTKFFAQRLNPIVQSQPETTYGLGAIVNNPSFLYHYLLSFPYRVLIHLTQGLREQIIVLRLLNTLMAVGSLWFLRKTMLFIKLPEVLVNTILLLLALTPIFTVLSAQINYDNAVILAAVYAVYQTVVVAKSIQTGKPFLQRLLIAISASLLACLIKFSFVPILIGVTFCLLAVVARQLQTNRWRLLKSVLQSRAQMSPFHRLCLAALLTVGLCLFGFFYGSNTVRYHNPVPQCNQVLSVTACKQYYSWNRNNELAENRTNTVASLNIASYTLLWTKAMCYHLFAALIPTGGIVAINSVYLFILITMVAVALLGAAVYWRRILRDYPALLIMLAVTVAYLFVLWARNYHDYQQLGEAVAIQGRYMLPVLGNIYVLLGLGFAYGLRGPSKLKRLVSSAVVSVLALSFLWFGGTRLYETRVSPQFGWPKSAGPADGRAGVHGKV